MDRGLEKSVKTGELERKINLMKRSQRKDVQAALKKITERDGLKSDAFEKATWGLLSYVLGRNCDIVLSMSKARKLGWTG